MALSVFLLLILVCFSDCGGFSHPATDVEGHSGSPAGSLSIGAFNIQIFGLDKMEDEVAVANIIEILKRYDLVLIQEIRDSSETAIFDLLDQFNTAVAPRTYGISISERLGRTSSKEQYAFFYDQSIFTVLDEYTYHDNSDVFEREPYIVTFGVTGYSISEFAYLAIHSKPDDAVAELDYLVRVYDESIGNGAVPTSNWLFGGDFNADCTYVGPGDWDSISLWTDTRFSWIIDNDADSTVSVTTDCAYDRFVLSGNLDQHFVSGSSVVYDYWADMDLTEQEALDVSDHYPVEMDFN
ncbi:hypothetical protein LSH36_574g00010 [Paralvinella palmiformis]|uniref:Deoxyribonuclease n=1 Tax=Paralvinella palmiformis TaxID=53620 RepID=A0AAD9MX46_9ANNE|nr:hypothetical protein LSH36_574g00010 [Paralvinella palmiformis]